MLSEFWQIQIQESDRYKTAFTVPFGQYEWNVMPFGIKNADVRYGILLVCVDAKSIGKCTRSSSK